MILLSCLFKECPNKKGGVLVKGKNTNDKKPKLNTIIIVAIINGLFALATALINVLQY